MLCGATESSSTQGVSFHHCYRLHHHNKDKWVETCWNRIANRLEGQPLHESWRINCVGIDSRRFIFVRSLFQLTSFLSLQISDMKELVECLQNEALLSNACWMLSDAVGFGLALLFLLFDVVCMSIVEGSLEVKLRTICRDGKEEVGRVSEKKSRSEKTRDGESQKKKDAGVWKGRKVAVFFQWFGAPEGRKVTSLKRRVWSKLARWEMKDCAPWWCEAHFQVKMYKAHHARTTFGSWDVEKVDAVVARSTFPSQNVQNTPGSDHFWKFRCRKSARRCGAKHVSKSKCTKHTNFGSSAVEKVHAVVARSTFPSQTAQNAPTSDHFWKFSCRKSARHCGTKHMSKSKCTKHTNLGPLLEVQLSKKCTPLWRKTHVQVKMYKTH